MARTGMMLPFELLADRQEILVLDDSHDAGHAEVLGDQTGDDVGLVVVGDAVEDVRGGWIRFLYHFRLAAVAVQEGAIEVLF